MKVETGSFSANSTNVTVLLNDSTLNVKGIFFQASPTATTGNPITGFTDGSANRSGSPRSTIYCAQAYSGTTVKVAGKMATGGLSTPGQFSMTFDHYDAAYPIDFTVIGD